VVRLRLAGWRVGELGTGFVPLRSGTPTALSNVTAHVSWKLKALKAGVR